MKKIIYAIALMLLPVLAFAQAPQKIAIVDVQTIFADMPDTKAMQKELEALQKKYEESIEAMKQELQKKYEDFVQNQEGMLETIKVRKQQEIQEIDKRVQDLYVVAQEDLQKKQQQLVAPIQQKIKDAISKVGAENSFAYVLDAQMMHYVGASAINATPLVRAKLGLK